MEVITERTWIGTQSIECESIRQYGDDRLRIAVDIDFYQFQSHGKVERWDGRAWQQVVYRAGQTLVCWDSAGSAKYAVERGDRTAAIDIFQPDFDSMVAEALAVIGLPQEA